MKLLNSFFDTHFPSVDCIQWEIEKNLVIDIDILRLDQLHPQISGNKWAIILICLRKCFIKFITETGLLILKNINSKSGVEKFR